MRTEPNVTAAVLLSGRRSITDAGVTPGAQKPLARDRDLTRSEGPAAAQPGRQHRVEPATSPPSTYWRSVFGGGGISAQPGGARTGAESPTVVPITQS